MNSTSADSPALEPGAPHHEMAASRPPGEGGWPLRRWLLLVILILMLHVALIFIFGQHQFPPTRVVKDVPHLQLADNSSELIALDDPTLFALPHANDLAFLKLPEVRPPSFRWTEPPRWLPLPAGELGAVFNQFMQTNRFAGFTLDFKPPPKMNAPSQTFHPAFAQSSTVRLEGELKQRPMINHLAAPSLPDNDVLPPTVVQVLVDGAGNVVSVVLLESSGYAAADQRAMELARTARFAPSSQVTIGQMVFDWRTVPAPAPAAAPTTAPQSGTPAIP